MGQSQSRALARCLDNEHTTGLEERCEQLNNENERLRKRLVALEQAAKLGDNQERESSDGTPLLMRQSTLNYGSNKFSGRTDDDNTITSAAAVVAAAEATATYQRSLVQVDIDNETDERATVVTVRAPNRRRLLGDMTGALTGLGLSVRTADVAQDDDSTGAVAVLRFALVEGNKRITDEAKIRKVEQRLQQRSAGREGLAGGVKRLVVARYVRATPPWAHDALESRPPTSVEEKAWIETLRLALGPSSEAVFGCFSCVNAKRLAIELLPEMHRLRLPSDGGAITFRQTAGEWLLLLENGDALLTVPASAYDTNMDSPVVRRRASGASSPKGGRPRKRQSITAIASTAPDKRRSSNADRDGSPRGAKAVAAKPSVAKLLARGSLLWEHATPSPRKHSSPTNRNGFTSVAAIAAAAKSAAMRSPSDGANGGTGGGVDALALDLVDSAVPWINVKGVDGAEGLIVRACHLSTVRQRLVTLREASAREHAQMLAEIPLFAPLTTAELLALCRRATVVEVPPNHMLLPHGADSDPFEASLYSSRLEREQVEELRDVVTASTFGLVLSGGLQIALATGEFGDDADDAYADAYADAAAEAAALPPLLPLAHLGVRDTFGELADSSSRLAFLNGGGRVLSSKEGARLLCWPRDSILSEELAKLRLLEGGTSLLEQVRSRPNLAPISPHLAPSSPQFAHDLSRPHPDRFSSRAGWRALPSLCASTSPPSSVYSARPASLKSPPSPTPSPQTARSTRSAPSSSSCPARSTGRHRRRPTSP